MPSVQSEVTAHLPMSVGCAVASLSALLDSLRVIVLTSEGGLIADLLASYL